MPSWLVSGEIRNRSAIANTTTTNSSGHFTIDQALSAESPIPSSLPTASASGPLSTRANSKTATTATTVSVISTCSGRSFQNGRSSSTAQISFVARMNAPM